MAFKFDMCIKLLSQNEKRHIEEDEHIQMLLNAIKEVKPIYIEYVTQVFKKGAVRNVVKRAERVFAYELYHQFRKLMSEDCNYYLNGEIWKDNKVFKNSEVESCYPDLVLHGSLGCIDDGTQYFLCEIKMADNPQLLNDLDKLTNLSNTLLKFKNYIFLCVGLNKEQLLRKIDFRFKKKLKKKYNPKIVCICVDIDKTRNINIDTFKLQDVF